MTTGDAVQPEKVEVRRCAAGVVASSFQAEMQALVEGLEWLWEHREEWEKAGVATDSQSALRAMTNSGCGWLDSRVARVTELGREMGRLGKKV